MTFYGKYGIVPVIKLLKGIISSIELPHVIPGPLSPAKQQISYSKNARR